MSRLLYSASFLLLALMGVLTVYPNGAAAVVTCQNCSVYRVKCVSTSLCCTDRKQNGACTPIGQTCPPPVECGQQACGLTCEGEPVYCAIGKVCCNGCQGQNICVNPGQGCTQDCPDCGVTP